MIDILLIRHIGIIVVSAAAVVLVARLIRIPSIVAYIIAGLILGPVTGVMEVTETIELVSTVGIALLLFLVGLELSLDKIRGVAHVAVIAGLGQVVFTAAGGFLVSYLLGFPPLEAAFLATALTFSSTVVVVKLLTEKGELDSLYGRIAVGIFLVQDMVVIVILTFLSGVGSAASLDLTSTAIGLVRAFTGMGALLALAMLAARYVLPAAFTWISRSLEALFIWSLFWCFLFVGVAEWIGLSIEIGAFVAGVSLAQLPYGHELRRRVQPLMNFFIAIFFTSLGIQMELQAALDQWLPALVLSLFVLLGNPLIFMWIIARLGYSERTSFKASVTVAQISEFSFIFAAMGLSAGLIGETILSVVGLVGLITIVSSAYMILYNGELYERLRRFWFVRMFGADPADEEPVEGGMRDHVVVVGLNSLGIRLVKELLARGETVLAIDTDPSKLSDLPCRGLLGSVDQSAVLEEANVNQAKLVVSALRIEDTNNLLAYRCRQAGVPCSIHAFDRSVVRELEQIGASHLMIPNNNGIKRMLDELRDRGIVEA